MKHLILAAATLALISCGGHEGHGDSHMSDSHTKLGQGIEVSSAFVNAPLPGRDTAASFFSITNHGADDKLLSASSPISEAVEIHTHINEDGVMKMRKIEGVDLPKGKTIVFKPGSYHLMMFKASIPDGAEDVAVTLTYENADPVTLIMPIGEPDENEDDHSGH